MLPTGYIQCLLNALPMNLLSAPSFPLSIIGAVHESSSIHSLRAIKTSEAILARSQMLPAIKRSDKGDWLFTITTDVFSTSTSSCGTLPVMKLSNEFRVFNPNRHKVKSTALQTTKSPQPDYENSDSWSKLAQWHFPIETARNYASLNGDINPIHLYPWTAKLLGYRSCIAHGMYSVLKLLDEPRFAEATAAGKCTVTATFTRPTLLPNDVLAYTQDLDGSIKYACCVRDPKSSTLKETVTGYYRSSVGNFGTN